MRARQQDKLRHPNTQLTSTPLALTPVNPPIPCSATLQPLAPSFTHLVLPPHASVLLPHALVPLPQSTLNNHPASARPAAPTHYYRAVHKYISISIGRNLQVFQA